MAIVPDNPTQTTDEVGRLREQLDRDKRLLDVARLLQQGEAALARKEFDEAEKAFTAALKLNPDEGAALKGLLDRQKEN